jgi:preprotein translocase subunit SecD
MRAARAILAAVVFLVLAGCDIGGDEPPHESRVVFEVSAPDGGSVEAEALDRTVAVIQKRLDRLGLDEADVDKAGAKVELRVPKGRRNAVLPVLTKPGRLELYDLQDNFVGPTRDPYGSTPRPFGSKPSPIPGAVVVTCGPEERYCPGVSEEPRRTYYYVLKHGPEHGSPEMTGKDIRLEQTRQDFDAATGEPVVFFEFTAEGARKFQRLTRRLAARGRMLAARSGGDPQPWFQQVAIVLDREIKSAPVIDFRANPGGIPGDQGVQITGLGSVREAKDLALVLQTGELPVELRRVSG